MAASFGTKQDVVGELLTILSLTSKTMTDLPDGMANEPYINISENMSAIRKSAKTISTLLDNLESK